MVAKQKKSRVVWEHTIALKRHNKRMTNFPKLDGSEDFVEFAWEQHLVENRETLWLIVLDSKHHVRSIKLVSAGDINTSLSCPGEIAKHLLLSNAQACAFIHSHPTGIINPSEQDIGCAAHFATICKLLNVELLDFAILGTTPSDGYYSLAENEELYEIISTVHDDFITGIHEAQNQYLARRAVNKWMGGRDA